MKKYILSSFSICLIFQAVPALAKMDWSNPAVLCPEEILPRGLSCLDLSKVSNPSTDFPEELSQSEIKDWKNNKAVDLKICRNQEFLKRVEVTPGLYKSGAIEAAWMIVDGAKNVDEKLKAIQEASLNTGIPPQILMGAMKQESIFSSLGLSPDGGNFSCGIAQLNIQEWCESMNKLSEEKQESLGWPKISCEDDILPTNIVKPLYDIAMRNNPGRPNYLLTGDDFADIKFEDVTEFPEFNSKEKMNKIIFQAASSFTRNCQNVPLSISAFSQNLKSLYNNFVPKSFKKAEIYPNGSSFERTCKDNYLSKTYPLHTGWLLAVAMYNAGPVQTQLVGHYYQVKGKNFPKLNPLKLIEALHWGGKWKKGTDNLVFKSQKGKILTQKWRKSCVVQRHVARLIQYVTAPGESIAKSLEKEGCKTTGVPEYRKVSSGIKEK
jgi:hypothetical protein